ncbi:MAG: GNAT family N-acetyltransferase, partial [Candidatus Promineifilaceae bacterium]
ETARYWAIELNDSSHELIGYIGFLADTPIPGMGYLIARKHWRKGYGREACLAVMDYGFVVENLEQIELWIHEDNEASLALAENLGFQRKGRLRQRWPGKDRKQHTMVVYGMWLWEWRHRKAPQDHIKTYGMQVALAVHDVQKSAEFYRDKLGFRIDLIYGSPPQHANVSRMDWTGDNVTIQLTRVPESRELGMSGHVYIFADEGLKRLHRLYRNNGVEIVSKPETKGWGMLEFAIRDCNGYVIMFGTHAN